MKKLRGMLWAKILASVFLFFMILAFAIGGMSLIYFDNLGVYSLSNEEIQQKMQMRALENDSFQVLAEVLYERKTKETDSNFRYAVLKGAYNSIDESIIQKDSVWMSDNLSEKTDLLGQELHYLTVTDDSPDGEKMGISEANWILDEAFLYRYGHSDEYTYEYADSYERTVSYGHVDSYYDDDQKTDNNDLESEKEDGQKETFLEENATSEQASYTIVSYAHSPMVRAEHLKDIGMIEQAEILSNIIIKLRNWIIVILVGTAIFSVLLFLFLLYAAGHTTAEPDQIKRAWWNRIPLDFQLALVFGIIGLSLIPACLISEMQDTPWSWILFSIGLVVIICYLSALWYCISFAIHVKAGKWWRNTLIYKTLRLLFRTGKKGGGIVFHGVERLRIRERLKKCRNWLFHRKRKRRVRNWFKKIRNRISYENHQLKLAVRVKILFAAACLFEFFWVLLASAGFDSFFLWVIGWLIEKSFLLWLISRIIYEAAVLQEASGRLAQGDMNAQVDTSGMLYDTRIHGENLNQIGQGIRLAVSEQIKSERTKTELITNVSHDIKTPLTSIINYTDLLCGLQLENESADQYLEVLRRQSIRLKKLIEDLIEASKASAGNIQLTMEEVDTEVILDQTIGEFEEKLRDAGIELLVQNQLQSQAKVRDTGSGREHVTQETGLHSDRENQKTACILADSRYLWRIFENLMNNICKYAQPGTRAYINLTSDGKKLEITFRNISRARLNISAEELMERFVRGDGSRHEEGNGLGLSIAESLAELMNGKLTLSIDGDLFKAVLTFPTLDK